MSATQSRVPANVETMPISLWWALMLGTCGASLIALTVAAQIYLSMLHHGHSFVRIAVWQLCSWSVWAAATPVVLRLGGRLTDRSAPCQSGVSRDCDRPRDPLRTRLFASRRQSGFSPTSPWRRFASARADFSDVSLPVDLLVYGLLLLIGASLAVYQWHAISSCASRVWRPT